ncbi:MAG TPA: hypothetical protein VFU81_15420, partial [Thermomicrobiales bacterium]|nr:hypothetical protein [Thermomicrobiales bacterium]
GRGFGGATAANAPAAGTSSVVTCGTWGNGPAALGDWGRFGPGMMGNAGHPGAQGLNGGMWGMMASLGMLGSYSQADVPLAPSDVARRLAAFAASCGPDFHVANVTLFANDAYAQLSDGTGTRLGEVLVDRYTGLVVPEPGPNLLWNTRWGLAAGTLSPPRYDELAARELAATFLASYLPGATLRTGAALPGYDTFAYGRGQTIDGLLSVNTMTGAIWAHAWIGPALGGAE